MRDAKGEKERITLLPATLLRKTKLHFSKLKKLFKLDQSGENIQVALPYLLNKKYPNVNTKLA